MTYDTMCATGVIVGTWLADELPVPLGVSRHSCHLIHDCREVIQYIQPSITWTFCASLGLITIPLG
jgi:hypothetical protein